MFCLVLTSPFFDDENDMDFTHSTNTSLKDTSTVGYQRVNALFADVKLDGQYLKLQQMTDETLMDVCYHDSVLYSKINAKCSLFRIFRLITVKRSRR